MQRTIALGESQQELCQGVARLIDGPFPSLAVNKGNGNAFMFLMLLASLEKSDSARTGSFSLFFDMLLSICLNSSTSRQDQVLV